MSNRTTQRMWSAAQKGELQLVASCLDNGADIEWHKVSEYGRTALHVAARNGHEAVVRLLLDRGANINSRTHDRWTPLYQAVGHRHESVVRLLLDRKADINAVTNDTRTALHIAATNGDVRMVQLLLERGADTTIVSVRPYLCHYLSLLLAITIIDIDRLISVIICEELPRSLPIHLKCANSFSKVRDTRNLS